MSVRVGGPVIQSVRGRGGQVGMWLLEGMGKIPEMLRCFTEVHLYMLSLVYFEKKIIEVIHFDL